MQSDTTLSAVNLNSTSKLTAMGSP
jgi:hypothetical protein